MRDPRLVLGLVLLAAAAATPAAAQTTPRARGQAPNGPRFMYWALREITFPVPVDDILKTSPKPAKLRFYVAADRGKFTRADERAIDKLDVIDPDKNRRGFRYESPADGEYDFALQFVYPDGDTRPREDELTPLYRVVFDTRPPVVTAAALGSTGVEWAVQDENPDQAGVSVEVRWQGTAKWTPITPRPFALRDKYTWRDLNPAQPLEVRVVAKDKAGHEMPSRVVSLPATGGKGLGPDPVGFGGDDSFPAQPQIDYVNKRDLTVSSKLTRVTRSGVKSATLWVNDGRGGWKKGPDQPLDITPATADPTIRIPYAVQSDGLYGFIVIPVNGAGGKHDDPRVNDPAQFLIEVDTEAPYVKVTKVSVTPGGALGPRVEILWDARDKNLMPDPIVLEYSETRAGGEWKPIAAKIPNTGRYVWEVEDKNLWKFYVRARAVDKASNSGDHVYEKEIIVDLEKPQAVIDRIHGGGSSGSAPPPVVRESERPAAAPVPPPAPAVAPLPKPVDATPPVPALPSLK